MIYWCRASEFNQIEALTREAVEQMLGFEQLYVGVIETDEEAAGQDRRTLNPFFGLERRENRDQFSILGNSSRGDEDTRTGSERAAYIGIRTNYILTGR